MEKNFLKLQVVPFNVCYRVLDIDYSDLETAPGISQGLCKAYQQMKWKLVMGNFDRNCRKNFGKGAFFDFWRTFVSRENSALNLCGEWHIHGVVSPPLLLGITV